MGIVIVLQDVGRVDEYRRSIEPFYGVIRAAGSGSSKVETCVVTLAHPLQDSKKVQLGAVSKKELEKLAHAGQAAAAGTRTGIFFAVGLHPQGNLPGLNWCQVGHDKLQPGSEIKNDALAKALEQKTLKFSQEESVQSPTG